jgi:transmembrane sensor
VESHRRMEDQAAAFLARRDGDDWTEANQLELEQWLIGSTARRVAFLRLELVWDEARRLKALSAGLPPGSVPPPDEWRHTPFFDPETDFGRRSDSTREAPEPTTPLQRRSSGLRRARRVRFLALAATILLALGIGAYFNSSPKGDRYRTPIGGIETVPLRDGSNITLNTATQVRVELTPKERHIRLDEGEAFFEVAHDPNRPFIVQVGSKRVIAVGTKFSVRREGDDVRVVVTEGKVRVETGSTGGEEGSNRVAATRDKSAASGETTAFTGTSGPGEAFLTSGSVASVGDDGIVIEQKPVAEAQDDLSWRQGYLTFHDVSLADAVAEFNRYNTHRIEIEDPAVAAIRISGSFRALNYEAFVRVLDDGFAIHARSSDDTTTLIR